MTDLPRWLDRAATAAYLSLRGHELSRLKRAGRLPVASYHLEPKSPRWDRAALDAVFTGTSAQADTDLMVQQLAEDIRTGRFQRRGRPPNLISR